MDKVKFNVVWTVVEKVMENRFKISRQLKEKTKIIQENSLMTIRRTKDILSGS